MIHELKRYEAHPGKGKALKERFERATMPAFQRTGITLLQAWDVDGEPDSFCYLVSFASPQASEQAWKAFAADPGWKAAKAESERDGPLLARQTTTVLNPLASSVEHAA